MFNSSFSKIKLFIFIEFSILFLKASEYYCLLNITIIIFSGLLILGMRESFCRIEFVNLLLIAFIPFLSIIHVLNNMIALLLVVVIFTVG